MGTRWRISDDGAAAERVAARDLGEAPEVREVAELRRAAGGAQIAARGDIDEDRQWFAGGGVGLRCGKRRYQFRYRP